MKCVMCRQAETISGTTSVTFERDQFTLVVKDVPAQVCPNCGETYVDEKVAARLLREAENNIANGSARGYM
ncbi:MAG: type II toxin-antitoxin system MqsA family antitoxin [Anaerolineales bacterium]|nr:type II toxin-antitoxin system MqsA family antitoxin [Anaerolineales bacterium]